MEKSDTIAWAGSQLQQLREQCEAFEARYATYLSEVHPKYADSARNLVHYLALRETDISHLQDALATLGLSSLDRAERNVVMSIKAVQSALTIMADETKPIESPDLAALELRNPDADRHKRDLLGDTPDGRDAGIMVTLPTEASEDISLVTDMLEAGMSVARINCARDDRDVWAGMASNIHEASEASGISCRIVMDLAGRKIRTGPLKPGPKVLHLRPRRDPLGRTIAPRRVRFIADDVAWRGTKAAVVPVPRDCIELAQAGDEIRFLDTRGKKRTFIVAGKDAKGLVLDIYKPAYVCTGMSFRLRQSDGSKHRFAFGELPRIEQPIRLRPGDRLRLTRAPIPGEPAVEDADGKLLEPAHVSCTLPDVFDFVAEGERVALNDGKIIAVVSSVGDESIEMTVTKAKPIGSPLRGGRGINFPDSDVRLPGLTLADMENLEFVAERADAVGLSFVQRAEDVVALQDALSLLSMGNRGLILKIETKKGFRKLPQLMLTAMRSYPIGVMIARGDLAVEAGWERLAELQEEILWLCEAAHVPAIWATEVLDSTAKRGQPTRAEISDAALSERADCVMLNKGPYVVGAIRMLDNILRRMQRHQYKKAPRMRRLRFSGE